MNIRQFTLDDYATVIDLWLRAGISLSRTDSIEGITHKLERDAELFLVAEEAGRIIGAVMGCYDGYRGWVKHLAVDPEFQGAQVGKELMAELERRFRQVGCEKINLHIAKGNEKVQGFYQKLGYRPLELTFMEKWITE